MKVKIYVICASLFVILPMVVHGDVKCENSLNYSQLCPNPRKLSPLFPFSQNDININLMLSSNSKFCEFSDNNRNTSLREIQVSEVPWVFDERAKACPYHIKLKYSKQSSEEDQGLGPKICGGAAQWKLKKDVWFRHSFYLAVHGFNFEDTILNNGNFSDSLNCTPEPKYATMLFNVTENGDCSIIVQQFRLNLNKNGCDHINYKLQFCGLYCCDHLQSLLKEIGKGYPESQRALNMSRVKVAKTQIPTSIPSPNLTNASESGKNGIAVMPLTENFGSILFGVIASVAYVCMVTYTIYALCKITRYQNQLIALRESRKATTDSSISTVTQVTTVYEDEQL